jgi:2-keto-4-pentenoate hydratase
VLAGAPSDEGYAVQAAANARLAATLGPVVGHKIGGTNKAMRGWIGFDEPVGGEVFASTVHASGVTLAHDNFLRPGIETEIAVRLAHALPARPEPWTRPEVEAAVGEVMAAIELVDDRYQDFRTAGPATIIADNAFNAASILGEPARGWRGLALDRLAARTFIDGALVAEGTSDALLGHPLAALLWLAERRRRLGLGLAAAAFVSLGSITPVQWLDGPAQARIEVAGLGVVRVTLTA